MSDATEADAPMMERFHAEWTIVRAHQPNVLLEGTWDATQALLGRLAPHIHAPVKWSQDQELELELPGEETRGLILRNVGGLTAENQTQLLTWMSGTGSRTQIVSTTERPLYGLVARGLFDQTLYYRLNVMMLCAGASAV